MPSKDLAFGSEAEAFKRKGKHTVYEDPANRKSSTVPRPSEICGFVARRICRDWEFPNPTQFFDQILARTAVPRQNVRRKNPFNPWPGFDPHVQYSPR
jgi:hypothetical protein